MARTGTLYSIPSSSPGFQSSRWSLSRLSQVLGTSEGFFEVIRPFMLGKSFTNGFQSTVRRLFARSPQLLADAYSVAIKSIDARHATASCLDGCDFRIGARCLQGLMDVSSSVSHLEDAAVTILLGQAMLVYNTLIPSPATHVITQGMLLSVKHWYSDLLKQPDLDAITLTPVLMDTVECLIRREIPVIRIPTPDRCIIDRFLGVCSSLLPLLYDLCERSFAVKANRLVKYAKADPYTEIERKIHDWAPDLPSDFFTTYSALEVNIMLAQVRSYRIAALLVIHRLRFPLGIQRAIGELYAGEILRELSILKTWPHTAATGLGLDFPLLVATLELPGLGTEVYAAFEPLRFRRQHSDEILEFINFVMEAKDNGHNGLWFELVHDRLHGVTLT